MSPLLVLKHGKRIPNWKFVHFFSYSMIIFIIWSVTSFGRSVYHNFPKGWKITLSGSYRNTCLNCKMIYLEGHEILWQNSWSKGRVKPTNMNTYLAVKGVSIQKDNYKYNYVTGCWSKAFMKEQKWTKWIIDQYLIVWRMRLSDECILLNALYIMKWGIFREIGTASRKNSHL